MAEKIASLQHLRERIVLLESRRSKEEAELKQEFLRLQEALRPAKLLKSAAKDLAGSLQLNGSVADLLVSTAGGLLSKKLVVGKSGSVFRNILGSLVELLVAGGLANNADAIRSAVMDVVRKFMNKEKSEPDQQHETT